MPQFFVIDDDGPARATREALRQNGKLPMTGPGTSSCDAVIADPCVRATSALAACDPAAQLVTISREGAIASIHDVPDFPSMAGRLTKK
jgi:hypothetical protein